MTNNLQEMAKRYYGHVEGTPESIQRKKMDLLARNLEATLLNFYALKYQTLFSEDIKFAFSHLSKEDREEVEKKKPDLLRLNDSSRTYDERLTDLTALCLNQIPTEIATSFDYSSRNGQRELLRKCIKAIILGEWVLRENIDSTPAFGYFIMVALRELLDEPRWTKETYVFLAVLETHLIDFFVILGGIPANTSIALSDHVNSLKKKADYKERGMLRRETIKENDHMPVVNFIMSNAKEGRYTGYAGKWPGNLAKEIEKDIWKYNQGQTEETKFHPYGPEQLKTILKTYFFDLQDREKLPTPLEFNIKSDINT